MVVQIEDLPHDTRNYLNPSGHFQTDLVIEKTILGQEIKDKILNNLKGKEEKD